MAIPWVAAAVLAAICTAYCLLHVWAEKERRDRLQRRFATGREVSVRPGPTPLHVTAALLVTECLAKVLGVPGGAIRLEDRFDRELRLRWGFVLLDKWDEAFFAALNEALAQCGVAPWRGSTRNLRAVSDLVGAIELHLAASVESEVMCDEER